MRKLESAQAKDLGRRLVARLVVLLLAYTAAFGVVAAYLEKFVIPDVADLVAEATSDWMYLDWASYVDFMHDANLSGQYWDSWPVDDDTYAVRNLDTYNAIKSLKIPIAILAYATGFILIVALVLRRAIRYFDELSCAAGGLLADRSAPVELSDDLSIVRAELTAVRERSLADDRAAQAAETRKNELVAYLAHDIKTPLTSVIGYLELLRDNPDLPEETRERYARVAFEKAERLDSLVDEFFEITRYNLKSMPIERERIDVGMLVEQVADELFPDAEGKGVAIEVEAEDGVRAFADPDKTARALSNIARNAVAYAERDSTVLMRVSREDSAVRIAVENRGKEISAAHLESVFEKFFREDGARATNRGGAGLGLAIAREIVQAHGGGIAVSSEAGRTVFTVEIPSDVTS